MRVSHTGGMSLPLVSVVPYRTVIRLNGTDTTVWINQSPGFEALLAPINDKASSTAQFYTFSVVSYVSSTTCTHILCCYLLNSISEGIRLRLLICMCVPSCLQLVRPDVSDALVLNPLAGKQAN